MWSSAQIDQRATSVNGSFVRVDFLVDDAAFELIVGEHLKQFGFGHLQSFKWLFLLYNLFRFRVNNRIIVGGDLID